MAKIWQLLFQEINVGGPNKYHGILNETTDDESEDMFQHAPTPSQGPIMVREHVV